MFHGDPGTGKTMMANALAKHLGKKVLLVNLPAVQNALDSDSFRFLFREAQIQDVLVFFDE